MKKLLIILGMTINIVSNAQTTDSIDSLRNSIIENLDQYNHIEYSNKSISNEDAVGYDTAYFYYDINGRLVYINWQERSHTFHIMGDHIDITELFFMNGSVVFEKDFGYSFVNPQWHLEPDLDETDISVVESTREYYKVDGTALVNYESRKTKGKYKDRFTLLDSIPLTETRRLIWSDRCDECIEKEYLSIYRKLLEKEQKH